ncbi:D-hexose-6-phosphate mutarotase [Kytococcus sedentarius]|uniref:D-hexose-6-phosphate mutarotase n=1 Tax=Kytococcus sedentarius TaxID=1276 RepID=UPI0035BC191A
MAQTQRPTATPSAPSTRGPSAGPEEQAGGVRAPLPSGIEWVPSGSGAGEIVARTAACALRLELQGAQVLSFVPAGGSELLWLSPDAVRAPGQAVRGGIPLCAPWFADGPDGEHSPSHGPARTTAWTLESATVDQDGTVRLGLTTTADGVDLRLDLTAAQRLHLDLTLGLPPGAEPRRVEAALHTYFAVAGVDCSTVTGLDGATVVDKLTGQVIEQAGDLRPTGAVDRIHRTAGPEGTVGLDDGDRSIGIESQGCADTVVWSPGPEGARSMADTPDDGWHRFLCVESACVGERADGIDHSIHLEPGGSHTLSVTYSASDAGGAAGSAP